MEIRSACGTQKVKMPVALNPYATGYRMWITRRISGRMTVVVYNSQDNYTIEVQMLNVAFNSRPYLALCDDNVVPFYGNTNVLDTDIVKIETHKRHAAFDDDNILCTFTAPHCTRIFSVRFDNDNVVIRYNTDPHSIKCEFVRIAINEVQHETTCGPFSFYFGGVADSVYRHESLEHPFVQHVVLTPPITFAKPAVEVAAYLPSPQPFPLMSPANGNIFPFKIT